MKVMHINPYYNKDGKIRSCDTFYVEASLSNDEFINHVINHTSFHYRCGKKIFEVNQFAKKAIDEGNYIILNEGF